MNNIKKIIYFILIIDSFVIVVTLFLGKKYFLNTQVAFFSSLFIYIATYLSYQKHILHSKNQILKNSVDAIDKIEDPFDLYSTQEKIDISNPTKNDLKKLAKPIKQHTIKNLQKSFLSYISIFRLLGYAIFILGFFYLLNHHILDIFSYIFGLIITPIGLLFIQKNYLLSGLGNK